MSHYVHNRYERSYIINMCKLGLRVLWGKTWNKNDHSWRNLFLSPGGSQCFYQFEILRVSLLNSWGVHRHVKTCWGHGLHAGSRQPLPHVPQRPLHEGADSRAEGQHGRSQALVRGGPVHQPDSCQDHAETGKTLCPPPARLQCPHTLTGFVCFYVITYSLPGRLTSPEESKFVFCFQSAPSALVTHSLMLAGQKRTDLLMERVTHRNSLQWQHGNGTWRRISTSVVSVSIWPECRLKCFHAFGGFWQFV